jgi:hypothetical protein
MAATTVLLTLRSTLVGRGLVDPVLQDMRCTKDENLARMDRHLLPGLRVAPHALPLLAHEEAAEGRDLDRVAAGQRIRHFVQHRFHELRRFVPFINKFQQERNRYFTRYELSPAGNKELKARSIQARLQQKRVWFPRSAPWLTAFESELLQFPAGAHDDQVDALANIGRILDKMSAGRAPKPAELPRYPTEGVAKNKIRLDFGAIDRGLNIGR